MPVAISVKAVNATAQRIEALWEGAALFEDEPSMRALGYPPHLTFAVYDTLTTGDLKPALDTAFARQAPFSLVFESIRIFEGPALVLWAAPRPCAALGDAHAIIHRIIDPAFCRPHYRPGAWVPHCTLAMQVPTKRRQDALAFASHPVELFEVVFDVADIVQFPPVRVAQECALLETRGAGS